jgi:hypothetical protein
MPDHIRDARSLVESRLAEIDVEARRLEHAAAAMGEGPAGHPGPGRRSRRRAVATAVDRRPKRRGGHRPKAGGRAPRGRRREELLAAIGSSPGARPADLARQIGAALAQVHTPIARARTEKLIFRRGKGYALKGG